MSLRSRQHDVRSRVSEAAASARRTLRRRGYTAFVRLPRPLQQTCRLIGRTGRGTLEDRVPGLAAEAAFFTLISLPALLLAVVGSLGFVAAALGPEGRDSFRQLVLGIPKSFLSDPSYATYKQLVDTVLTETRGGVVSVALLLSVWTGSRAVNRYLETITIAYDLEPRPGWRRRLLALGVTIGLLLGAGAVLPPMVFGPRIVKWVAPDSVEETTLHLFFWPSVVAVLIVGLATMYHVGAPWRTPWRRDLPGALLAMAIWLLASAGLRTYLSVSVRHDAVFGQLAVPIAVVLWLYITAFAVLLGAEFNAAIERMWPHVDHPWRLQTLRRKLERGAPARAEDGR
ncbi:ribonuclease BN [Mycolicibacterium rhodesiae]|uniref:Ribonuclease BN n=1 Tax=Mycolicibacterium rhodesiae TaxID=36814 RepID=A0A1X0IRQ6_MYCRH|nr:ribonuclease BN [Mycolicibacterium rhodesiae]